MVELSFAAHLRSILFNAIKRCLNYNGMRRQDFTSYVRKLETYLTLLMITLRTTVFECLCYAKAVGALQLARALIGRLDVRYFEVQIDFEGY